jgi:hypothetical protein
MNFFDTPFDARKVDPRPYDPWQQRSSYQEPPRPDFADDEELRKSFGICLGKGLEPFPAGLELFPKETSKALWASVHWSNDPIAIAARDAYKKTLKSFEKPLDKEELLNEVLTRARKAPEDRDAATLFKLYSEIAGFTGKVEPVNVNNNTNNTMKITFVSGTPKEAPKVIDHVSSDKSKILNEDTVKLKLVGGTR